MTDPILQSIREEYPTATSWTEASDASIRVMMTDLTLIGGIAGDLTIGTREYALTGVVAAVSPENRGDLICTFSPIQGGYLA